MCTHIGVNVFFVLSSSLYLVFVPNIMSEEKCVHCAHLGLRPKLSEDLWSHPKSSACHKPALLPLNWTTNVSRPSQRLLTMHFFKMTTRGRRVLQHPYARGPHPLSNPVATATTTPTMSGYWALNMQTTVSICPQACHCNENKVFHLTKAAVNCQCTLTHLCRNELGSQVQSELCNTWGY